MDILNPNSVAVDLGGSGSGSGSGRGTKTKKGLRDKERLKFLFHYISLGDWSREG
jgi:hypothetical protein